MTKENFTSALEGTPVCKFTKAHGVWSDFVKAAYDHCFDNHETFIRKSNGNDIINSFDWGHANSPSCDYSWASLHDIFRTTFSKWEVSPLENRLNYKYY